MLNLTLFQLILNLVVNHSSKSNLNQIVNPDPVIGTIVHIIFSHLRICNLRKSINKFYLELLMLLPLIQKAAETVGSLILIFQVDAGNEGQVV